MNGVRTYNFSGGLLNSPRCIPQDIIIYTFDTCIDGDLRDRDCMVVGFTTTCAISAYGLCKGIEDFMKEDNWWLYEFPR
jgi:hypothetical protein